MRIRRKNKPSTPAAIIVRSKLFQDYQRAFSAASGLSLLIREPDATTSADWPSANANAFCARLAATVNACAACREFQAKLAAATVSRGTAQTRPCHAGLSETMLPVRYGNRVFALLHVGQVRLRATTDDELKRAAGELTIMSPSLDSTALAAELKGSRSFDPARYAGLVHLLEIFSTQLAEWFVRIGAAETPRPVATAVKTVMRIKEWLDSHYHKPITLIEAANAVGLSPWYLSKVVHRGTGMQFRELVVQVRIERAQHLLTHDGIKISEVAAAVGFQSISQFNRTFLKANGQSAGKYRRALAARQANGHEAPRPNIQPPLRMNGHETTVVRVA